MNIDTILEISKYLTYKDIQYLHFTCKHLYAFKYRTDSLFPQKKVPANYYRNMSFASKQGFLDCVKYSGGSVDIAAKYGHLDVVMWLCGNPLESHSSRAIDRAAAGGYLDVVKWLSENSIEGCTIDAMNGAAENNHFEVVKWLRYNRSEGGDQWAIRGAAKNGNFEMVKFLCEVCKIDYSNISIQPAVMGGNIDIVKYFLNLLPNKCGEKTFNIINYAAESGNLELVKFLHKEFNTPCEEECPGHCSKRAMTNAVESGNFEMLRWMYENPMEHCGEFGSCDTMAMKRAAGKGNLEILKWLYEIGAPVSSELLIWAVYSGKVEVVEWVNNNIELNCNAELLKDVIYFGGLKMVKWFYENRKNDLIVPDGYTKIIDFAIECNNYEIVEWLLANTNMYYTFKLHGNISPDCEVIWEDSWKGNFEMLKRYYDNTDGIIHSKNIFGKAIETGQIEIIKWLEERKDRIPLSATYENIVTAVQNGHIDMIKYLYRNTNLTLLKGYMDAAIQAKQYELISWFHENSTRGCSEDGFISALYTNDHVTLRMLTESYDHKEMITERAFSGALIRGNLEIALWLYRTYPHLCNPDRLDVAVAWGYFKMTQVICSIFDFTEEQIEHLIKCAEKENQLHIAKWLKDK